MEKFNELVQYVQSLETDFHKFYEKGQAAAGTRVRFKRIEENLPGC